MKFIKNLEIGALLLYAKLFRKRIPLFVSWSLTNRCNLHCRYCEIPTLKSKELSTEQVFKVIDELYLSGTRVVSFTGGEPLLREDIGRIIDYAKSKGIYVKLNSNGILVKKRIKDIKNLDVLQLSFDGPKAIHDRQRGKGSYDSVIEAINIAKENNIRVYFNTTVTRFNVNNLDYIFCKIKEFKIPTSFQPVTDILFCTKNIGSLYPKKGDFNKAIKNMMKEKRTNPYILNSYNSLRYMSRWPLNSRINCFAGKVAYRISSDGGILPCNRTMDKSFRYNCLKDNFKDVLGKKLDAVCNGCWCITALELNYAFALRFEPIFNIIRLDYLK